LIGLASAKEIKFDEFPNVQKLIQLQAMEKIDFRLANLEEGVLIEEIHQI